MLKSMLRYWQRPSYRLLAVVVLLMTLLVWVELGISRATIPFPLDAKKTSVLHVLGARHGPNADASFEAWLDLASYEGKIVEMSTNGTVRRVSFFVNDTYINYLIDANTAIIRHNINSGSPQATYIRDELLFYRVAVERGVARVVNSGRINNRTTDVIKMSIEGAEIVANVDRETGLVLSQEISSPGQLTQMIETTYSVIEYLARLQVSDETFQLDLPAHINREEYYEVSGSEVNAPTLSYAVYAAPDTIGELIAEFRRLSTSDGVLSDAYYMIYRSEGGEVQVISSLPPDPKILEQQPSPLELSDVPKIMQIEGIQWEITSKSTLVRANATLDSTFVTIFAQDQQTLEKVAASLQRVK